jgi:hypothetical protein
LHHCFPQLFSARRHASDAAERDEFAQRMKSDRGLLSYISGLVVAVKVRGRDGNRAMLIFAGETALRGGGWNRNARLG